MALEEYRRKRDFKRTPEPSGAPSRKIARRTQRLSFVIQKHAARRLHYDFRLELDGVLKSWAVPRGPSLDPGEKRLAVHVEDHPLEYGGFEGVIPPHQYGSGTVMLWDHGMWEPEGGDPAADYRKGHLKFRLEGEKLHGRWALVRMGGQAARENHENWLLIKERDEEARPGSGDAITQELPDSVESGRGMDEIAEDADRIWDSRNGETSAADEAPRRREAKRPRKTATPMPDSVAPQLATLGTAPPEGVGWLHEIKFDGYRIIARLEGGTATLLSRNQRDWSAKFPELQEALADLPIDQALLDGEVVALDSTGKSSFSALQKALSEGRTGDLVYCAFDLLFLDGVDLRPESLTRRKQALALLIGRDQQGRIRYSDDQPGRGADMLRLACELGLEGIVSKRRDSPYRSGRSSAWLKTKCGNREEFIVIGFTPPRGSREGFGALILGYYDKSGALNYAGRVGTGFDREILLRLQGRMKKLQIAKPALRNIPKGTSLRGIQWIRPELVAEIRFAEWTPDAVLRQPAFLGLREDKSAREVVIDRENRGAETPAPPPPETGAAAKPGKASAEIAGQVLTRADKVLYPGEAITKLDLARYYDSVADWALPHLAGRLLSLVRCPEGRARQCFFQKHASEGMPAGLRTTLLEEKDGSETGLYILDKAGLIGLVQMGVLEIHPWGSRIEDIEHPDRLTFDLDPEEGLAWDRVIEAALLLRSSLAALGLESFAKTTGGKGLHVVVPIRPTVDWPTAKAFCKALSERIADAAPDRYTTVLSKKARRGRIFIDYLRNGRGATAVGAFSTRARPAATVSTPLSWDEVEAGTRSDAFNIGNLPARLAALPRDPWAEFLKVRQSITATIRRSVGM